MSSETDVLLKNQNGNDVEAAGNADNENDDEDSVAGMSMYEAAKHASVNAITEVKEAFQDQLEEALEGDDFFLSMALTKNLSILPCKQELTQAVEEIEEDLASMLSSFRSTLRGGESVRPPAAVKTTEDEEEDFEKSPPLKAYLTLGSAVCALSSIGPCLAKQIDVDATLKIVWRFQGTVVLLSPLAIHSIAVDGIPKLTLAQWLTFLMAAASYAVLCVAFAMSINYTTVANATILTNSQSVMMVVSKLCFGQQVIFLEGIGVFIAFFGTFSAL